MRPDTKSLIWLSEKVRTPPFSKTARLEAGFLLRQVQSGQIPPMPHSRPMPSIGPRCHELRIHDQDVTWRLVYRVEPECVMLLAVFDKKTAKTPKAVIDACKQRIKAYQKQRDEGQ